MATPISQLSNPFSTGDGGGHFESKVQASFVVLMLSGGFVPCLPLNSIEKIKLQGKFAGFQTDDLVVFSSDAKSGKNYKLLGQIKHSIAITESSDVFAKVVKAAWEDYRNSELFDRETDRLALITGPLSSSDVHDTRTVLEWARHSENSIEFFQKVEMENFSSEGKRSKLRAFRAQIKSANNDVEPPHDEVFDFLRHFHLLGYDLDMRSGVELSLLHSLIGQYGTEDAGAIWLKIVDEVEAANSNAGTITMLSIREDVRSVFQRQRMESIPFELATPVEIPKAKDWSFDPKADSLVYACLLGSWDEKNDGDRTAYEAISKKQFRKWLIEMQQVVQLDDSPIGLANGKWFVRSRISLWNQLAASFFDWQLDEFGKVAVRVLGEIDPKFDLPKEDRFAAVAYGKQLSFSGEIRSGMAETIALLGVFPEKLIHASHLKAISTVTTIIRNILSSVNWKLWASIDRLLPLLSEGAPSTFLDLVEAAASHEASPFVDLFGEEGHGIAGGNYLTGLLWALEGLAWDKEYLARATLILGQLAAVDPGGNWINRPINSLSTIFLPWLPQTTASAAKRKSAIRALRDEIPQIAWKVSARMLPNILHTSSGSHKPRFREPNSVDFKVRVTRGEYQEQVSFFAGVLVDMAEKKAEVLVDLLQHLDNLPVDSLERTLDFLESSDINELGDSDRERIRDALVAVAVKHKKFRMAKWAMAEEVIERVSALAEKFTPTDSRAVFRRLFCGNDFDLYEDTKDWRSEAEILQKRRNDAVESIIADFGVDGITQYASTVEGKSQLGWAYGQVEGPQSDPGLPLQTIGSAEAYLQEFMNGYLNSKYARFSTAWLKSLGLEQWQKEPAVDVLCRLPFRQEIWNLLPTLLGEDELLYWRSVNPNPYSMEGDIRLVVEKLLDASRPRLAIECIFTDFFSRKDIDVELVRRSFIASLDSDEPPSMSDPYHIIELIKELQNRLPIDSEDLFRIEWGYVSYLEPMNGAEPKCLERRLAKDPEFLCELIQYLYRSRNAPLAEKTAPDPEGRRQAIAMNAFKLLSVWKRVPGLSDEGKLYVDALNDWLASVRRLTTESGHLDIAMQQVGKVMFHAPSDEDGLWIHRGAAKILNDGEAKEMRIGYNLEVLNSRGVHSVDPTGADELQLAKAWHDRAEEIEDAGFVRFAASLKELAGEYEREAEGAHQRFAGETGLLS